MKTKRGIAFVLAVLTICTCLLAGCSQQQTQHEISSYQGQLEEGQTKSIYNKDLFFRTDQHLRELWEEFHPFAGLHHLSANQ